MAFMVIELAALIVALFETQRGGGLGGEVVLSEQSVVDLWLSLPRLPVDLTALSQYPFNYSICFIFLGL